MAATASATVEPYTRLPNRVLKDNALKPGPRSLWHILISYAWKSPRITISQARLASDVGVHVRTVRRWTKRLEEAGYVRVFERQGCVHQYELVGDYKVNPGQPARIPQDPPRTADQYQARDRGSIAPDQSHISEIPSPNEAEGKGVRDPWARFRTDPAVRAASKVGIMRQR
jgi:DNA-binding transcriptional ArsR family regulator